MIFNADTFASGNIVSLSDHHALLRHPDVRFVKQGKFQTSFMHDGKQPDPRLQLIFDLTSLLFLEPFPSLTVDMASIRF